MTDQIRQDYSGSKTDAPWIESFERQKEDILWCWEQPEILERYANRVLILHHRQIIGVGRDHIEALEDTERRSREQQANLPPRGELVFAPIPESMTLDPSFFPPSVRVKMSAD